MGAGPSPRSSPPTGGSPSSCASPLAVASPSPHDSPRAFTGPYPRVSQPSGAGPSPRSSPLLSAPTASRERDGFNARCRDLAPPTTISRLTACRAWRRPSFLLNLLCQPAVAPHVLQLPASSSALSAHKPFASATPVRSPSPVESIQHQRAATPPPRFRDASWLHSASGLWADVDQQVCGIKKYKGKDGEVGLLTTVVVEPWRIDELLQSHELRKPMSRLPVIVPQRYTPRGRISAVRNLDLKKLRQATYSAQLQMS